jgi:hypothetical protein
MDKIYLRIISFFNPILEKSGVNTDQLQEILKVKLLIDSRRPRQLFAARRGMGNGSQKNTPSWRVALGTILMGLMVGLTLIFFHAPMVGQIVYFSMFMILLAMTMISDFTTVLFDARDQFIIMPRPVDERTITISRILHIAIYITRLAVMQGLIGLVIIGFIDGIMAVPLFFLQIIAATFITIVLVNIIYLLLMRSVTPQKFKDIISYFQIAFSIVIFAIYYLLPRLVNVSTISDFNIADHQWVYVMPPAWIASLNEVLIHPSRSNILTSILAILGITVPVIGMWLVAKVLAPGFNRRLAEISSSEDVAKSTTPKVYKVDLRDKIANSFVKDPLENAGFKITWKLAARLREFKMKVFPSFAFVPIYFIYFMINGHEGDLHERFNHIRQGSSYIILIYMSTFVLSSILQYVSYSEKYKAGWVYYAMPVTQPGKILSGMYKAIVTIYFLPYVFVLGVIMIAIWGPSVINDLILAFFATQIHGLLMALFMVKRLPFTNPVANSRGGGRAIISLLITAFIGIVGFAHYFLMRWEILIWILIIPAALIFWAMLNYYKKQTWANIEMSEL